MSHKIDSNLILAALKELDHDDDAQWTAEGLPSLNVIESLVGAPEGSVTREAVTTAAPDFKRISDADFDAPQAEQVQPEADKPELLADGKAVDDAGDADAGDEASQDEGDDTEESLTAAIEEARSVVEHLDKVAADARKAHADAVKDLDALILRKQQLFTVKPADAVRDYVESQMRLREQRAGVTGVYRSPLDMSMRARKRSTAQIRPAAAAG